MNFFKKSLLYLDVIPRLGVKNVAYVAWYRLSLKTGLRKRFFLRSAFEAGQDFFHDAQDKKDDYPDEWKKPLLDDADKIISGKLRYYARHWKDVGSPPDWFLNPFNQIRYPGTERHWTELPDFHPKVGDIKNLWEASRFEWVVTLARAYMVSGENIYLDTLNSWIKDWARNNPVNTGPNWKCGQEAGIRVFNLLQALLILEQWQKPNPVLVEFIALHLRRISSNIGYALAQDNNHGTSEAAALFIGGSWLKKSGAKDSALADHYAALGRKHLESRVRKLVDQDGSFSQHSVTYHRVLLDTLCFAETWRKTLNLPCFNPDFYQKAGAAAHWLWTLSHESTGAAPNLGSNDGAMLLNCHNCDYRDFRPSIQASQALFKNRLVFPDGPWNEPLFWLGIDKHELSLEPPEKESCILDQAYVYLRSLNSWGMIRLPFYRFRPSHNDVFHFDLWYKGVNICRDAGSYSYNSGDKNLDTSFKSVDSHNTASFDGREQMPRMGRFMMGKWVKPDYVQGIDSKPDGTMHCQASYTDHLGCTHQRRIEWKNDTWVVEDQFKGSYEKVQVRYRLMPDEYILKDRAIFASWGKIEILSIDCDIKMIKGLESLYYWEKQDVDVVLLQGDENCRKIVVRFNLA